MVCTFIKAYENKKELYLALIIELQNNEIKYSEFMSNDGVCRIKAECSKSEIQGLGISKLCEFREYSALSCSNKKGLESVIGNFNFYVEDEFLRMHFESILKKNEISVIRNIENNFYKIKNKEYYLVEHDWNLKYSTLKSYNLIKEDYVLIEDGNNLKVQKLI